MNMHIPSCAVTGYRTITGYRLASTHKYLSLPDPIYICRFAQVHTSSYYYCLKLTTHLKRFPSPLLSSAVTPQTIHQLFCISTTPPPISYQLTCLNTGLHLPTLLTPHLPCQPPLIFDFTTSFHFPVLPLSLWSSRMSNLCVSLINQKSNSLYGWNKRNILHRILWVPI